MPTDQFPIAADADDGTGYYQDSSWPPSGGTWSDYTGGNIFASKVYDGASTYTQDSAFLRFDTSSIPDGATITAASLSLYVVAKADSESYSLVGDYYDFGGEPTVAGDYEETPATSIFTAEDLTGIGTGTILAVDLTDLTGINKTGYTGIRLTLSAGTPTSNNYLEIADHESANTEPTLEVTYTTGGTSVTGSADVALTLDIASVGANVKDGASSVTVTVTVGSSGTAYQVLNPSADSADGNWTDDAAGTALAAAIDEDTASDSDYIQSEVSPSASGCRVKLESGNDPVSSSGHVIKWRVGKSATGGETINVTVKLMQGGGDVLGAGTQIASFDRNDVDALTSYTETLSGAEADAITNYADLYLEFYASVA